MRHALTTADRIGLAKTAVDAHTLGLTAVGHLLGECGVSVSFADVNTCRAFDRPDEPSSGEAIERWIERERLNILAFSYRLDPGTGADLFGRLVDVLDRRGLLSDRGGPVRAVYFAGLPEACRLVREGVPRVAGVFSGDETPSETLATLGVNPAALPRSLVEGAAYDDARLAFGRDLVRAGGHESIRPVARDYPGAGTATDSLVARLDDGLRRRLPPVMRAHVGPFLPDRHDSVELAAEWARVLARSGMLDVLSLGTSQLTQSRFGEDWGSSPNGGGVPINSEEEYAAIWRAARPMLVRTYAGTSRIPELARMYERTIHIAWHALSLWWFCQTDGRGPNTVKENLAQHIQTLRFVAETGTPFEPNVAHHFGFRGSDDVSCVASVVLAAMTAKSLGIRHLVLQIMLNTPRYTWGVADLAKARAMLQLTRELADGRFSVILQPRGGLDYFSPDLDKARAQLAAVTALMDDIEPEDPSSPGMIHVVSYSEASHLADPAVIDESIRITRHALAGYRALRARGDVDDMRRNPEVIQRTAELVSEVRELIRAIEIHVHDAVSVYGLYRAFADGFLPVPHLWLGREEFARAVDWRTELVRGSVRLVDGAGKPMSVAARVRRITGREGPQ